MIQQYLAFYRLDGEAIQFLRNNLDELGRFLPAVIDRFYDYILSKPETASILQGHQIDRLKKAQLDHWRYAITSGMEADYMQRVERIGRAHKVIGLTPVLYVGGYSFVLENLASDIMNTRMWKMAAAHRLVQVFQRLILLDMSLAISMYAESCEEGKVQAMEKLLETMQQFTQEVGERVENATESAQQMNQAINEVAQQAQIASQSADTTVNQANAARRDAEALYKVAQDVTGVLEIITNVSEQTNLLALNAAIESARAGEAGRGFAVVADEVRKLAGTTRESVDIIAVRLKELQHQTQNVVSQFDKMVDSLSQIQQGSISISAAVAEESTAMNHISEGFNSLHQSVIHGQNEMKRLVSEAS